MRSYRRARGALTNNISLRDAERTIFVGNLPTKLADNEIISAFSPFGEIEDIFRNVHFNPRHFQTSWAFILYRTAHDALNAVDEGTKLIFLFVCIFD